MRVNVAALIKEAVAVSAIDQRRDRMFPKIEPAGIDRLRRFGEVRRFAAGERLLTTGEPTPGMFVLLKGTVAVARTMDWDITCRLRSWEPALAVLML